MDKIRREQTRNNHDHRSIESQSTILWGVRYVIVHKFDVGQVLLVSRREFPAPPQAGLLTCHSPHDALVSGYGRYFRSLSKYLTSQLGNKITMVGMEDRGVTGNFEVTVDGKLLHSKRSGQGKAESSPERTAILLKLEDLLEEE